jgi:two-component system response regulator RegX3
VKAKVLVVEDEEELAQLAVLYLEREGIDARICLSAEDARAAFREEAFDLVLLDINLREWTLRVPPGVQRTTRCQDDRIRPEADEDIIAGLSVGATSSSPNPSHLECLRSAPAHCSAGPEPPARGGTAQYGRLRRIQPRLRCLHAQAGSRAVPLSAREFDVLGFLVVNAGKTFSPQEIFERIWDKRYGDPTTIGVYVQRIRKKIEQNPKEPKLLETVKGKGYRFDPRAIEKGR